MVLTSNLRKPSTLLITLAQLRISVFPVHHSGVSLLRCWCYRFPLPSPLILCAKLPRVPLDDRSVVFNPPPHYSPRKSAPLPGPSPLEPPPSAPDPPVAGPASTPTAPTPPPPPALTAPPP